ncbi:MAG: DUF1460 domain-containing protein, partial [Bacteroidetes bacterium]
MKLTISIFVLFFFISSSFLAQNTVNTTPGEMIYELKDKEIAEDIFRKFADSKNSETGELMIKVGSCFLGVKYVPHTLEFVPEKLVVNLREFDCTTFAESVLALSRTIKSENPTFGQFAKELQFMRYHNGKINGYPSRIHYFSDWIYKNELKKLVKDVSKEIGETPHKRLVNFMSTHPESYFQLRDSTFSHEIANQEMRINTRQMFFVPKEKLAEKEHLLKDGDIAGITTKIEGLDISHVVLLKRVHGRIHILHASTSEYKVVLSQETLEDYLKKSKSATGIMVAR